MKKFWYESNAWFGYIDSLEKLKEMLKAQLEEPNGHYSIYQILSISKQHRDGGDKYGTYLEYSGEITLIDFLKNECFDFSELY